MDDMDDDGGFDYRLAELGFQEIFWTLEQTIAWVATRDVNATGILSLHNLEGIDYDFAYSELHKWDMLIARELKYVGVMAEENIRAALANAYEEVVRALQAGHLVATWKRRGHERSQIPRLYWADRRIERNARGFLDVGGGGSGENQLRINKDEVLKLWAEVPVARASTSKDEKEAVRLLADLMRKSPSKPTMTKSEAIDWVRSKLGSLGERPAQRAWRDAVDLTGAHAWSEPGRRSSANRNRTPS